MSETFVRIFDNSVSGSTGTGGYSYGVTSSPITFTQTFNTGADVTTKLEGTKTEKGISPKLYFKFVKAKFSTLEKEKLKEKLLKLRTMVEKAEEFQQQALFEKLQEMLAITVRELEAVTVGIDTFVLKADVDRFRKRVKDFAPDELQTMFPKGQKVEVFFDKLENFPRIIPNEPGLKISRVKDLNLFDNYSILFLDYTKEKIKTNKEKIREKDPIVFGSYAYAPERLYYICDWVDEFCDLTLDKLVETLQTTDKEFTPKKTPQFDEEYFDQIKNEVLARHERLAKTNSGNFRELMKEEDKKKSKKKWYWPWKK